MSRNSYNPWNKVDNHLIFFRREGSREMERELAKAGDVGSDTEEITIPFW
jgi:hypothetical protein